MMLIFELNTTIPVFVPVTLHGTSNVIPYWVWILFVVVTLHQWSANFFYHGPYHLFNRYWRPTTFETLRSFVWMCSCSDTGNMQLLHNSPSDYLIHFLFSQFVFFPIKDPGRTSGKPCCWGMWEIQAQHNYLPRPLTCAKELRHKNFISTKN